MRHDVLQRTSTDMNGVLSGALAVYIVPAAWLMIVWTYKFGPITCPNFLGALCWPLYFAVISLEDADETIEQEKISGLRRKE